MVFSGFVAGGGGGACILNPPGYATYFSGHCSKWHGLNKPTTPLHYYDILYLSMDLCSIHQLRILSSHCSGVSLCWSRTLMWKKQAW